MDEKSESLFQHKDEEGAIYVDLKLCADGSIRLARFDHGPASDRYWGGDYERSLTVAAKDVPALCFALLRLRYADQPSALSDFRDWCSGQAIPLTEGR